MVKILTHDIAQQVRQRAAQLETSPSPTLPAKFISDCLAANERGDGCLFSALYHGRFIYNFTAKEGEWYQWQGNCWTLDDLAHVHEAVDAVAVCYLTEAALLGDDITAQGISAKSPEAWKIAQRDKFIRRAERLRSKNGAEKALHWAPIVDPRLACRESDFDSDPWLLPVANGVIDLRTGALTQGRPADMLTRSLSIAYDPHADYGPWADFVAEISADPEVAAFVKRSLGYAITGHSYEQHIWVFTGPGRNGKGVLFDLVGDVMRPYYHVISRAMLIEQRSEPSPSAASEHLYSLLRKRILVGAETNKGQKIDAGAVKTLTGDDDIKCRPLFKGEVQFKPSHALFLHTNHVPVGLTRDFALVQRLYKVEFPYMYVDDPDYEARLKPAMAAKFRRKNPTLKDSLRQHRPGILRWLVEGCLEWQQIGLSPPASIRDSVATLARSEDYISQFADACLEVYPDTDYRVDGSQIYDAFRWWFAENMDSTERRIPAKNTLYRELSERGMDIRRLGGRKWVYGQDLKQEVLDEVKRFKAS